MTQRRLHTLPVAMPAQETVDSFVGVLCTVTTEVPPEFELIQTSVYHWAYIYKGEAETAIITCRRPPDQITPPEWIGDQLVKAFADELKKEGRKLIEIKVYADTTPIFWTDFRIEVTASTPSSVSGETASPGWPAVVAAVLIIIGLIVLFWFIKQIIELLVTPRPGFEAYKKALDQETLVGVTNDFEEYLELPITPPETLAAMAFNELQDYCDLLGEEIAPKEISLWTWLAIGGAAAVALGGATYIAKRKKKK